MFQNDIFVETISQEGPNKASYSLEPLSAGYGQTIGNSLRRVLLSSLEGAAADSVAIEGVEHEFSTLDKVKEDIVEIILNLKKLRFDLKTDEAVLILEKKGKGEVTAADFQQNTDCVPTDPQQYIATVANGGEFMMRLTVKKGRGYETIDMKKDRAKEVGVISLDSDYSPIVRATYRVEHTRVGQETNLDKVILDVETDGSRTAESALQEACSILVKHFSDIGKLPEPVKEEEPEVETDDEEVIAVGPVTPKTKVEEAGLSSRTTNALLAAGFKTVSGLIRLSEIKLEGIKGLGSKGLEEVKAMLTRVE